MKEVRELKSSVPGKVFQSFTDVCADGYMKQFVFINVLKFVLYGYQKSVR